MTISTGSAINRSLTSWRVDQYQKGKSAPDYYPFVEGANQLATDYVATRTQPDSLHAYPTTRLSASRVDIEASHYSRWTETAPCHRPYYDVVAVKSNHSAW